MGFKPTQQKMKKIKSYINFLIHHSDEMSLKNNKHQESDALNVSFCIDCFES